MLRKLPQSRAMREKISPVIKYRRRCNARSKNPLVTQQWAACSLIFIPAIDEKSFDVWKYFHEYVERLTLKQVKWADSKQYFRWSAFKLIQNFQSCAWVIINWPYRAFGFHVNNQINDEWKQFELSKAFSNIFVECFSSNAICLCINNWQLRTAVKRVTVRILI